MGGKRVDRRVQRTRKLLSDALVALIVDKGYERVTIQDILDRANVGRSTFYAHFENKEQLLFSGGTTFSQLLERPANGRDEMPAVDLRALFDHIAENRLLAKAMIGRSGGDIVARHLREVLAWRLTEQLAQRPEPDPARDRLLAEAAAAALVSVVVTWVEEDLPLDPHEVAVLAQAVATSLLGLARGGGT